MSDSMYGINLGINSLSQLGSGWTRTMMKLDAQEAAQDAWRKEFLFKQDQATRRNLEADRRWNFENEKYEAGEDLRDTQLQTSKLQLEVLNKQWNDSKLSDEQSPLALQEFADAWDDIYVRGNPEQTYMNYTGFLTGLAAKYPKADVSLLEKIDKMFKASGVMTGGNKAWKSVEIAIGGRAGIQILNQKGRVISTHYTGKYSPAVAEILNSVDKMRKEAMDTARKNYNTAIAQHNAANKGALILTSALKEKDDDAAAEAIMTHFKGLEKTLAIKDAEVRDRLRNQLAPFVINEKGKPDPDEVDRILAMRLGKEFKLQKPMTLDYHFDAFENTFTESIAEADRRGKSIPPEFVFAMLKQRVDKAYNGDNWEAANQALMKLKTIYLPAYEESGSSIMEYDLAEPDEAINSLDPMQHVFSPQETSILNEDF